MASSLILATRIQNHPSRAHLLPDLIAALDGLGPEVITDPGGAKNSPWRTHALCLDSTPADATHLIVVQDDAAPCEGFAAKARAAIEEHPGRIICFFTPGFRQLLAPMQKARKDGHRFMEIKVGPFVPLVCVAYPAEHAREIVPFTLARRLGPNRSDDAIVAGYVRSRRIGALATVPCLADHRDDVPSLLKMPSGQGKPHRIAAML